MPKLSFSVPHTLIQDEVLGRLKEFLPRVKEKFQGQVSNLEESWDGSVLNYSFTTFGFSIKGKLIVEEKQVKLDQDLPFAAMMFKGKIEEAIRTELEKLLR